MNRINLCAENSYSNKNVPPFGNRFTHYAIRDHNACSLGLWSNFRSFSDQIIAIIDQCQEWFNRNPNGVVAIHCKVVVSGGCKNREARDVLEWLSAVFWWKWVCACWHKELFCISLNEGLRRRKMSQSKSSGFPVLPKFVMSFIIGIYWSMADLLLSKYLWKQSWFMYSFCMGITLATYWHYCEISSLHYPCV